MAAATDAVIDEARQNLIPLSRQVHDAGGGAGGYCEYSGRFNNLCPQSGRKLSGRWYINLAGTLQPTGRRMVRDDYAYRIARQRDPAAYDPETSRVAPFF